MRDSISKYAINEHVRKLLLETSFLRDVFIALYSWYAETLCAQYSSDKLCAQYASIRSDSHYNCLPNFIHLNPASARHEVGRYIKTSLLYIRQSWCSALHYIRRFPACIRALMMVNVWDDIKWLSRWVSMVFKWISATSSRTGVPWCRCMDVMTWSRWRTLCPDVVEQGWAIPQVHLCQPVKCRLWA